jgi:YidC/Oxa1 family membrane protein insertase
MQLPVFISLFYMLRSDLKKHICGTQMEAHYHLHHKAGETLAKFIENTSCDSVARHSAKFLFLPDITEKATGAALVVLIVLYVGSQLASTLIATATADPNQRRLMLLLPVVFVVILYRYPAGLLVYWITTNLWTIGQQSLIRRHMPPPPRPVAAAETNGKPRTSLRAALSGISSGAGTPATEGAPASASSAARSARSTSPAATPPRPPRKKKKRSGRRR